MGDLNTPYYFKETFYGWCIHRGGGHIVCWGFERGWGKFIFETITRSHWDMINKGLLDE